MKVGVSFFSSKDIVRDLKILNDTDADYIHVDIMDGKFVSNKTMPFKEMRHISDFTDKRLDVHLMVEDASKYISLYAELNAEYITIHIEIDEDIESDLKLIKSFGIKAGLSIKPDTKVSELVPYLPYIDQVLIMSVEPGAGGQAFIPESENKIKEARALLKSYNIDAIISVDGGVNDTTIKMCRDADMVVSGSYVVLSDNFQEKISSLR